MHEVASVEDQVTIEILPEVMLAGLAEIATVGAGVGEGAGDAFAELDVAKSKSILATTGGLSIGAFSGSSSSVLFPETRSVTGTSSDNDNWPSGAPAMEFIDAMSPAVRVRFLQVPPLNR
jgi:hypothetical protein